MGRLKRTKKLIARINERKRCKNRCERSKCSRACRRTRKMCSKNVSRSFKILSKDGMILCQSINRCRKYRKNCRAYKTERSSARRTEDNERLGNVIEEPRATIDDNGHKNPEGIHGSGTGEEITSLQAGDERRGNCSSQSIGCCFDPTVVGAVHHDGSNTGMAATCIHTGRHQQVLWRTASASARHPGARTEEKQEMNMRKSRGEERRVAKRVSQRQGKEFR